MAVVHPEDLPEDVKDKLAELQLELSEGQSSTVPLELAELQLELSEGQSSAELAKLQLELSEGQSSVFRTCRVPTRTL
jgi:hypothetical protein